MTTELLLKISLWIISILGTGFIALALYIWQSLATQMKDIQRALSAHFISTSKISLDNIELNKDVQILLEKDSKRQSEIQELSKDVHLIKFQLKTK